MNKRAHIALHGVFPVSIWGHVETGDFIIHEFGQPVPREEILSRRLPLLAIVGLVDGRPDTALETPLTEDTIQTIAGAYVAFVTAKLEAAFGMKSQGDSVEWLRRLYQMPGEA